MSRALIVVNSLSDRQKAIHWANIAPYGTRIEFKKAKRSLDQNSKMWSMLTEVAEQVTWHGLKLTPDDWKLVFLDALKRDVRSRIVPNIDGNGFVNLGRSSSDLSKEEMSDLIEIIYAFGAEHDIAFADHSERRAAA